MFLTRLGFHSKAVITGDVTQVDLPSGKTSGLVDAQEALANIEGIRFCAFTEADVVRHPLVQQVVIAYDAHEQRKAAIREAMRREERGSRGEATEERPRSEGNAQRAPVGEGKEERAEG